MYDHKFLESSHQEKAEIPYSGNVGGLCGCFDK